MSAADRRASIIDTATAVFAESGFQCSTMAQIATRIGVTEPVLFQNFRSKVGLYAAVVEHASGQMAGRLVRTGRRGTLRAPWRSMPDRAVRS